MSSAGWQRKKQSADLNGKNIKIKEDAEPGDNEISNQEKGVKVGKERRENRDRGHRYRSLTWHPV